MKKKVELFKGSRKRHLDLIKDLIKSFQCGVCVTEEDSTIVYFNGSFPGLVGTSASVLESSPLSALIPEKDIKKLLDTDRTTKINRYTIRPLFANAQATKLDKSKLLVFLMTEDFSIFCFLSNNARIARDRLEHYIRVLAVAISETDELTKERARATTFKRVLSSIFLFLLFDLLFASVPGILTGAFLEKYFRFTVPKLELLKTKENETSSLVPCLSKLADP